MSNPSTLQCTLSIEGMNCGHCVQKVTNALKAVPGVGDVNVDLAGKRAVVQVDPATPMPKLMNAVNGAGFKATGFTRG